MRNGIVDSHNASSKQPYWPKRSLELWRALFAPELSRLEAWTWSCLRMNPDASYHISIDTMAAAVHTTALGSHFDTGRVLL